jgi:glycolate oxidase
MQSRTEQFLAKETTMPLDFVTNQEIIVAARRNLTQNVWDYLTGGAESETTMRRNRYGLDGLAFRPRVLVDVSNIDTAATFLGHKLRIPVMLAPIGSLQSLTPEGGVACQSRHGVQRSSSAP